MDKVFVFGRKNPNNDSIMSSLVFAQWRNEFNDGFEYVPVRLGELPDETAKMFAAWDIPELPLFDRIPQPLPKEPPVRVVLTDHNDPVQSVEGIEHAEVVTVIDHHRIAGMRTFTPLVFLALPWGATCTIIAHLLSAYDMRPTDVQAACLLSAIMTDTLLLKSPVTTVADTTYANMLAEQLDVDAVEFGMGVFRFRKAENYSPYRMVNSDVKNYDVNGKKILVGKFVCPDRDIALDQLDEVRAEMEAQAAREGAVSGVLAVVDLKHEGSQLLACGDTTAVEEAMGMSLPREGVWLDGLVSRKSQIVPGLLIAAEHYLRG